jgi:homopolymeric O-antigen transport system ATP-binding protein
MSDVAIRVEGLGKRYRLGQKPPRSMGERLRRAVRWDRAPDNDIWVLKDVGFEVKRGDVVGIVGANGAGKSTLLKILSRITEPTEGVAEVYGRVGSLLEVGTGFHPELSGRENIYLNGAILGMRKAEIDRKLDEIIAFAEIERFLDEPVKRYSSGMYVRLAFAVAAHLEPDVLLVDEVLSVGDASFQKRCLGKMGEVSRGGRTILLVTHNMAAIKSLTRTAVWLHKGRLREQGNSADVANRYLATAGVEVESRTVYDEAYVEAKRVQLDGFRGEVRLKSVAVKDAGGRLTQVHQEGGVVRLDLDLWVAEAVSAVEVVVRVRSREGQVLTTWFPGKLEGRREPGDYRASVELELGALLPGTYLGDIFLLSHLPQDAVSPAFRLEVVPDPRDASESRTAVLSSLGARSTYGEMGVMRARATWRALGPITGAPGADA